MNLGATALPTWLASVTYRTVRVFREMGKGIMTAFSFIKALPATAATPSLGNVLGIAGGLP